jgi:hypothetical protein
VPDKQDKTREYVLKGLGLLLVAVVSGMLWWLIQQGGNSPSSDDTASTGTAKPAGKYTFAKDPAVNGPLRDSNCEEHSYLKVKAFFKTNKCTGMTRQLYTSTVNGKTAYTSVSVVDMANAQDAQQLKALTEANETGNVSDLVRENKVKVPGLSNLSGGGFAAKVADSHVIIVESDFEGGSKNADESVLDDVSTDALRLGDEIRQPS